MAKSNNENRLEITVKDTKTGDILIKMNAAAICGAVTNVVCDGAGFGLRPICFPCTNDALLLKYTYKSAKLATKGMKKKYKLLKKAGQ